MEDGVLGSILDWKGFGVREVTRGAIMSKNSQPNRQSIKAVEKN